MARILQEGFIKTVRPKTIQVKSSEKAALIRKGNQLLNSGDVEMARKIFLSLGYSDGIIRIGDYYYNNADYAEAWRMYKIAPAPDKAAQMTELMANILVKWMEDRGK